MPNCLKKAGDRLLHFTLWLFRTITRSLLFRVLERPLAVKSLIPTDTIDNNNHSNTPTPLSKHSRASHKSQYSLTNLFKSKLGFKNAQFDMAGDPIGRDSQSLLSSCSSSSTTKSESNGSNTNTNNSINVPNTDYNYFYPIKKENERPLLAFSFGGMLWAYYLGVIACLRDHFDLYASQTRFSGISCGATAAFTLHFGLTIPQALEFGLSFQKLFDQRLLKFWFLSSQETMELLLGLFNKFGLTNQHLKNCYNKWGNNSLYFGVSAAQLCPLKLQPLNLHSFKSVRELLYCALCSMRTVPFFRTPGYYNGYFCIDGGVTQYYSIPDDYWKLEEKGPTPSIKIEKEEEDENNGKEINKSNKEEKVTCNSNGCTYELCSDNVIKIAVSSFQHGDLSPQKEDEFQIKEWVMSGTLDDNIRRFHAGYKSCADSKVLKMLGVKGLKWKQNEKKYNEYDDWNAHVVNRIKVHEDQIREHFK